MVTHNYDNPKTVEELNINLETLVRDISYISLDNTKLFNKSSLHRFKVKLNFMDQIRTFARRYYMSSENRKPKLSDFSNSFISKLFFKTKYCTELCGQERTEEETRAILHEVINRVWENSNLNISELVQNEFDQREEYQKRYEDECLKLDIELKEAEKLIDNLDKSVKAIKENHLVNNSDYTLTEEIVCASKCRAKRVVGFEKQRAKLRYSPFLVVEELEKVQQELKNLHFETKIKVDIKFGYVASQNSQIRYQSLCNLEKNNGLTVVQCLANLTTQPISKKLINGLNLIAKYDIDQKVAGKANELVEMYRLTEELNPGKKLESGKY